MATNCFDKNLLQYGGTSQAQRMLDALSGMYAQIDERTSADLILLTKKYSAYLNYYDVTNIITTDWQNIMSKDVSVVIASLADWRTKDYAGFIESVFDKIKSSTNNVDATNNFKLIFDFVFSLTIELDNAYKQLPADISFTQYLSVAVSSKLADALNVLVQYYSAFTTAGLIDETSIFTDTLTPVDNIISSQNFHLTDLSSQWQTSVTVPAITLSGNIIDDVNHIITHNLFKGVLQSFLNSIINIINQTPAYLEETLENYPSHEPHYALYLSFLRLFRFAQDHLNTYTQRHLDFYYKDVLQLSNNAPQPDDVHLVFELQKNIEQHLLSKGTLFKAGKDANNNDLFYFLMNDLIVQKASIQSLKSIYLNKDINPVTLFASSIADSEDGQGAKLLSADKSWFPFGNPNKITQATIGFAIASNILFLNEGLRIITITFQCDNLSGISKGDLSGIFSIQFTGKKNWFTASSYKPDIINTTSFSLIITMEGDAPSIIPYSQKIHGGNFTEALPMVQVLLTNYISYQKIKFIRIQQIILNATATVKNLSLQNDDGKINAAKPFKTFGEFPGDGASFIIGSKEIFQKSLQSFSIDIDWQKLPSSCVNIIPLAKGNWSITPIDSEPLSSSINVRGLNNIVQSQPDFTPNEDYTVTSVDGFLKLALIGNDYDLDTYIKQLPKPAVTAEYNDSSHPSKITGYSVSSNTVSVPPSPVAKSISVTYTAQEKIFFTEITADAFTLHTNFFYHIEPFGFREMHPFITNDALTFLPVFDIDDNISNDDGGELWMGLNNANADETFSLLFEVADGTANPLKIATQVNWYYLSNNNWLPFDKLSVTDQTNSLTSSGLVILNVPATATTDNLRADAALLWIKAVVTHDTDAVCKLISVLANAAEAALVQDIPNNIEFTQILQPNTISKPAIADAALKKTQQLFPSFDGRIRETDDQFYIRVSERLRHKHRAITSWDYEHLTLQYFPQIHKTKCINHTGFITDENTNTQTYCEVLPGHVMVVTIPDLTNLNTANPLRPYTGIDLLTKIEQYLQQLTSPFVKLHVCNPQFEEIQFDFEVTFYTGYDVTFYTDLLNKEIEQFLTPWAFGIATDIEFGSTIEKSVVLNFIEERYYVDYVTCFKMNQIILRTGSIIQQALYDIEEAVASTARSTLVSYYNEETKTRHIINSPANCTC